MIGSFTQGDEPSQGVDIWQWGITSSINNDTILNIFSNCNYNNVNLTVTDSAGCTATYDDSVFVYCNPNVEIYAEDKCFDNQPINFIDTSIAGTGGIASWEWQISGGTYNSLDTNTTQDPQFTFDICEEKTITLTVIDSLSCTDTDSATVNIWCLPDAIFSVDNVCEGLQTLFDASSSTAIIDTFIWSFSNGITSAPQISPTFSYDFINCGNYSADLLVIDNHGCKDSSNTEFFDVYCPPIADFSFSTVCEDSATTIWSNSQQGSLPSAIIDTWNWTYDDTTSNDLSLIHI